MGCGCITRKTFLIIPLKRRKSYDFSFPHEKAAGIGIFLLQDDPFHNLNWEKISSRLNPTIIPTEILATDTKICSKVRKLMIRGPPNNQRWELWKTFFSVKSFPNYKNLPISYHSSSEVILKDISRTFPNLPYFDMQKFGCYGQNALYRVLSKFATQYPKVGYCQGMNYVIGFLLMVSGSKEEEVYLFFVRLCEEFNLFEAFSEDMKELRKNMWIFDKMFEKYFPKLYNHFCDQEITNDMWIFKWLLSFFTTSLPINVVVRVWDYIIIKGLKGCFQVSFGILSLLQAELLKSDLSNILRIFEKLGSTEIPAKYILKAAEKIKIKRPKIEKYRNEYDSYNGSSFYNTAPAILLSPIKKHPVYEENIVIQEITETLDELPPFQKSKSGFSTPFRTQIGKTVKPFDYVTMGRISFIDERSMIESDSGNTKQLLDELVNEKTPGDSFIIQMFRNNNK